MSRLFVALILMLSLASVATADTIVEFEAILTPEAVITEGDMPSAGISNAFGKAAFLLTLPDVGSPTMSYVIDVTGIDLNGRRTLGFPDDDLTALHFHDTTQCSMATQECIMGTDTVGTEHVLNVAGFPREDDGDMDVYPVAGLVTGRWDDLDENLTFPPSNALSGTTATGDAVLDLLFAEKLFVNVHTNSFGLGEIGGFIRQVPEPSSVTILVAGLSFLLGFRRR